MPAASVADVLKAAKEKGIPIKAGLVYAVRAAAKAKKGKAAKSKPGPKPSVSADTGNLDAVIRQLAWTHGLVAIEASIQRVRSNAGL